MDPVKEGRKINEKTGAGAKGADQGSLIEESMACVMETARDIPMVHMDGQRVVGLVLISPSAAKLCWSL